MNWFLIGLIPPALWSVTNHLDKFLISKYFKGGGIGALMVFSSLAGVFLLPFILVFDQSVFSISPITAALIAANGFLYILAVLPYFHALDRDEASIVVPLFQMIPVLSYGLEYIVLKETLTTNQMIASSLVVVGAIGISLELMEGKKVRLKKDVFGLMFLSSLLFAFNFLFFKYFALKATFWTTAFWEYVGFAVFAVILVLFVKSYRLQFLEVMRQNKLPVIGLNGFNEIINIIAKMSFNFASLLAPVTLIWAVSGTQPFFVFIYGVLLTLFLPHLGVENLAKKHLAQKILSIIVMFIGTYLLNT
jgi:uncharacterized membrane protein